ncbi:hypothetical protein ES703_92064 [subsurface metagenome]
MVRTRNVVRDGLGFYWDARGILDQEQYRLIDEARPDPALRKDIELVKTILKKYPTAPLSGPMYERYMKMKATKRELWDRMREKILSRQEKEQGFKLLFDGKSMDQWRNYKSTTIRPQWQIIDGAMVLTEKGGKDIVTKEKYGFFDLRLEWTISEGGNSGIMLRVDEETTKRLPWMVSPEYQLKDPYGKPRKSAGALYGLVAAPEGIARKAGEWNNTRIQLAPLSRGREHLQCWLNDTKTVDLVIDHAPGSEWSKLVAKRNAETKGTKFELPAEFFKTETGPILLQDHGARVAFRNIRIRKLDDSAPPR